jgi:hypothetical protein
MGEPGYTPAHKGVSFRFINESSDYPLISRRPWPRRRAFSPQAVALLASQSLAAIINGVRACSVELRAARPAGFLT